MKARTSVAGGTVLLVARDELRCLVRNRVAAAAALLVAALVLTAALVSAERQRAVAAERARYQAMVDDQFDAQPDRHPHRMVHYGQFVFRPPAPLAFFDFGVDAFTGSTIFLEGHRQNSANFSDARQSSLLLRVGQLSPAFVLQTLVPLLIVFLGFASVARERESGTLRLLIAQGVGGGTLLAGKLLAQSGVALAVAMPAFAVLVASAASGAAPWLRAVSLIAVHATYLLLWTLATVQVSALAPRGRDALLAMVGAWIAIVMLVPRLLPPLALALQPTATRFETDIAIHRDLQAIGDSHDPQDPYFEAFRRDTLARYGVPRVEDLPVNYAGLLAVEGERLTSALFDRYMQAAVDRESQQNRLVGAFGLLSPAIAVRQASMTLAGTDLDGHQRFLTAAERYRYALVQRLNKLHAEKVRYAGDKDQRIGRDAWRTLPRFDFRPDAPLAADARLALAAGELLLWLALLAGVLPAVGRRLARGAA